MDQLTDALVAAQKLEKKLRQLRNRGEADDAQVMAAKDALSLLRGIARARGIDPVDIDSRGERGK